MKIKESEVSQINLFMAGSRPIISKMVNDINIIRELIYLYERWADEKNYEDFRDYEVVMKSLLGPYKETKFLKGTKRPLGFLFELKVNDITRTLKIYLKLSDKYANLKVEFVR